MLGPNDHDPKQARKRNEKGERNQRKCTKTTVPPIQDRLVKQTRKGRWKTPCRTQMFVPNAGKKEYREKGGGLEQYGNDLMGNII